MNQDQLTVPGTWVVTSPRASSSRSDPGDGGTGASGTGTSGAGRAASFLALLGPILISLIGAILFSGTLLNRGSY